jgi:[ribosomal protein S18]-alanine N-acetyltransferase
VSTDNTDVGPEVHVRPARPADFEELHVLDALVFGQLAYPYFTLRQLFDAFPDCWLVAAHEFGVVGYSFGVPSTDRTYAWLFGLAVDPHHRNRGHGRQLTRESLNLLGAMGVESVRLTVEPRNEPAISLYRAFGFVETGHLRDYFGPGDHRMVMTRRIHSHTRTVGWSTRESAIPIPRT